MTATRSGEEAVLAEPATEPEAAVEVVDLCKSYPGRRGTSFDAVVDVSFTVEEGEIFGILGPNGAGKTTTLEIVEGLREASSGHAYVFGHEVGRHQRDVQELIGVQLQASSYFDYLKLAEILDLFGSFYQRSLPTMELLEAVDLADKRNALVRTLSGGQSRRFSIVAALVNDPLVVFLDEPTAGLDPQSRRNLWEMIRRIQTDQGKTILLTTHYMEEASALCDRVLVMNRGRVQAVDSPQSLIKAHTDLTTVRFSLDTALTEQLRALPGVSDLHQPVPEQPDYLLRVTTPESTLAALLALAAERGLSLHGLQVQPATLEDVFLNLTGDSLAPDVVS